VRSASAERILCAEEITTARVAGYDKNANRNLSSLLLHDTNGHSMTVQMSIISAIISSSIFECNQ
jgi:hypothetical protein